MTEPPVHGVYDCETGELELVPLDAAELAAYDDRGAAIAAAEAATAATPELAASVPDGIVGWTCQQVRDAVCVHATCKPKGVTELEPAAVAAPAPTPVVLPSPPADSLAT